MEAPEKIFICNYGSELSYEWHSESEFEAKGHNDIEYTRTDAFIKKVEDYLNSQLYDWVNVTNPDQRSCANVIPKKDFIEDFRNYMKGE